MTKHLEKLRDDISPAETFLLSLDPVPQKIGEVTCLPWQEGLAAVGVMRIKSGVGVIIRAL